MTMLAELRSTISNHHRRAEADIVAGLCESSAPDGKQRQNMSARATRLVRGIRDDGQPGLMEVFLSEYGLSTDEGVALMCLAEALLRVPDTETIDALIEDKIAPSAWGAHLGQSSSSLVNASTWALMLTGKVLKDGQGVTATLKSMVKRLGEPLIRVAIRRAMKELGAQFVLGQTIDKALSRGQKKRALGYTFSYDMLGEAALTAADAQAYFTAYSEAITQLAPHCVSDDIRENPGISIKLSALHPRYETPQKNRVMTELVERTLILAKQACKAKIGFNIDAEEADRLDLSLDVIQAILACPELRGWDGFGVVVQAYSKRAAPVLDWLYNLANTLDRKIMVRLVKGAYWDTEIKQAQVDGLQDFPVFTQKSATDISYICCAKKLLGMTDRIYPQFATHNAHSVAAILEMADNLQAFEFQRLHGMGQALHDLVKTENRTRCRIYAPVGAHRDLLAYLVRRLLENGANSSFVNQIVDKSVTAEDVASDPFSDFQFGKIQVLTPSDLYLPERVNSKGWDLRDPDDIAHINAARLPFETAVWEAHPIIVGGARSGLSHQVLNPADPADFVGSVTFCAAQDVGVAISRAQVWDANAHDRAKVLNRAADLYEASFGEFFAILTREAGKTVGDAISELREAVDFLRFYAARATELTQPPWGVFTCISPWNFPLAIFTGQIAAALAAGNAVLAKPAETTSIIAFMAVKLLHKAGVPVSALQLLPGLGVDLGARLTSDARINGVCFTGSTRTAQRINRAMAENMHPTAPLIAETGGINAMIVDSTALPEQAVKDIIDSAFQSAGQRCSALRILYIQEDIEDQILEMLFGAMDELTVGKPWSLSCDLGPVIDSTAKNNIMAYIDQAQQDGRVLKQIDGPEIGMFIRPTVIRVNGIADLKSEVFGPVLHIATFKANALDAVVDAINATGFGLTFGMHSRIDDRIEQVTRRLTVGNQYINRNQIGAVVGSQPFGGEGLSGTGPKAGGPNYVSHFTKPERKEIILVAGQTVYPAEVQKMLNKARLTAAPLQTITLPGPTGESNRLSEHGRGTVLCLGPTRAAALDQALIASQNGCAPVCVAPNLSDGEGINGMLPPDTLEILEGVDAVISFAPDVELARIRSALAKRSGKIIPLITEAEFASRCRLERHICIDTTAAGGNASLLASVQ